MSWLLREKLPAITLLQTVSKSYFDVYERATCHLAHIIRFKCSFSHDTTVHHDKLIGRLESDLGLTDNVLAWFKSYLSDRFQCVFVNVSLSDQFPLKQGNKKMSLLNVQVKMHTNIYKFNIIG